MSSLAKSPRKSLLLYRTARRQKVRKIHMLVKFATVVNFPNCCWYLASHPNSTEKPEVFTLYIYTENNMLYDVDGISFYPHYPSSIFDHVFSCLPCPLFTIVATWPFNLWSARKEKTPMRKTRPKHPQVSMYSAEKKTGASVQSMVNLRCCQPWINKPQTVVWIGRVPFKYKYIETPVFFTGRSAGVTNWSLPDAHGHSKI